MTDYKKCVSQLQGEIPVRSWMTQIVSAHQSQPSCSTKEFSHDMNQLQTGCFFWVFISHVGKIFCLLHSSIYYWETKQKCLLKGNRYLYIKWESSYAQLRSLISESDTSGCCNCGTIHGGRMHGGDCLPALMLVLLHPIFHWCIRRCMHSGVKRAPRERQNKWFAVSAPILFVQQPCHFPVSEENRFQARLSCERLIIYSRVTFWHI